MYTELIKEESPIERLHHYVEDRRIEPCEVMEAWGLIHHHYLACAFKYLARAGRKKMPCLISIKPFGI